MWSLGCGDPEAAARCFDVCGAGTRCVSGRCEVVAEPEPEAAPEPTTKVGKRGRKRGRGDASPDEDTAPAAAGTYTPVSDRHIPRYDATATQVLDPDAGSERLDDAAVRRELKSLEPALDRCIADAVAGGVEIGSGRVDFVFGLTATGKVSGVTAKASSAIQHSGVVGCLRKVVFDHRFPKYDGPAMGVDYTFEIG